MSNTGKYAAAGATIGTAIPGIGTAVGGAVGAGVSLVSGLFGGGKEKNAGSSSFVDALDNYESMPTATAKKIVPEVTALISQGASNRQIADFIALKGGEPGNGNGWYTSWKWELVQRWIDKTRALQKSEKDNNPYNQPSTPINSYQNKPGMLGTAVRQNTYIIGAVLLLLGVLGFQKLSK